MTGMDATHISCANTTIGPVLVRSNLDKMHGLLDSDAHTSNLRCLHDKENASDDFAQLYTRCPLGCSQRRAQQLEGLHNIVVASDELQSVHVGHTDSLNQTHRQQFRSLHN